MTTGHRHCGLRDLKLEGVWLGDLNPGPGSDLWARRDEVNGQESPPFTLGKSSSKTSLWFNPLLSSITV